MIETLQANVNAVRERIAAAAQRSGRTEQDVTLVAVTKYVDAATTRCLFEAGCRELGESRPQVLWEKGEALRDLDIRWHMIGHLQRNKVKRSMRYAGLIHSLDSQRLMNTVNQAAEEGASVRGLLEVNVSGESAKHGFEPSELGAALEHAASLTNLKIDGLMCMAGLAGNLDDAKREFDSLRELRDRYQSFDAPNVNLSELSMGMSGDFEAAIESGATLVRVGSSLFEGIR